MSNTHTKSAIQFGAGNIGRGFIALLLNQSGYQVTFADVQKELIDLVNERQAYTVEILGRNWAEIEVTPVAAVHSDSGDLENCFLESDLVTTAVGPGILRFIAPAIARGLGVRKARGIQRPLNIIACENMIGGSTELKSLVYQELDGPMQKWTDEYVGFPDAAVDRIVPPGEAFEDPLRVRVEEFSEWIVDSTGFNGAIPDIQGMITTDNLPAYLERKLFTLNTGHAATAYLGSLRRYRTIGESISDPEIRDVVKTVMSQSGEVLIRRYDFDRDAHQAYIEKILGRFSNPALIDEIHRVGRQPLRKLSRDERLIKPLRGTLEYGTANDALVKVIVAALAFRHREDEQSKELANLLSQQNLVAVLERITGLGEDSGERDIINTIAAEYEQLSTDLLMEEYLRRRTRVVSLDQAGKQLPQLVDLALGGTEVILSHRGMPMVRFTPLGNYQSGLLQMDRQE